MMEIDFKNLAMPWVAHIPERLSVQTPHCDTSFGNFADRPIDETSDDAVANDCGSRPSMLSSLKFEVWLTLAF